MKTNVKNRINEIKLALCLNHIDKAEDKIEYNLLVKVLSSLVAALGKEEHELFVNMFQKSIGDGLMGASRKELVYTQKQCFSASAISSKFKKHPYWFSYTYKDLISRAFDNEEFLESMTPKYTDDKAVMVINFVLNFLENFKFELGETNHQLVNNERTLELEFYLIYNKILNITQSATITNNFIYNVCHLLNIDYNTIAHLKNNIYIIDRTFPAFKYNKRYFMQEITTLYTNKGLSKGTIGSSVFGKSTNFLYNNTNREYGKVIKEEDMGWQYCPTMEWDNLDKAAVMKFIDIFHRFMSYGI